MIHLTLAIAAFMQMMAEAIFWVAARFAGYLALGGGAVAVPLLGLRWWRRRPAARSRTPDA